MFFLSAVPTMIPSWGHNIPYTLVDDHLISDSEPVTAETAEARYIQYSCNKHPRNLGSRSIRERVQLNEVFGECVQGGGLRPFLAPGFPITTDV